MRDGPPDARRLASRTLMPHPHYAPVRIVGCAGVSPDAAKAEYVALATQILGSG
jgi:hypothetical protein